MGIKGDISKGRGSIGTTAIFFMVFILFGDTLIRVAAHPCKINKMKNMEKYFFIAKITYLSKQNWY
jgi:hypothetical protein